MYLLRFAPLLAVTAALAFAQAPAAAPNQAWTGDAKVDARVSELLGKMTLEEKVGQLMQYSSHYLVTGPAAPADVLTEIKAGRVGSMLNVVGAAYSRKMQAVALKESRLGIPLLFGYDVIHGYKTVFPIPLAQAASWDLAQIENAERIAAAEASAAGIHWTFSPMVDIARDPRWGRIAEGAGEDPYLGSLIARARVRGFQGNLSDPETVLACAKHFAGYGASQAGRDYNTTDIPERQMRDVYLRPFKAAVEEGVGTLMAAFNENDGIPSSANAFLMTKVLRNEWGFRGFVVSDWTSIMELERHSYAADLAEAGYLAFMAGLDMDMESRAYYPHLVTLVKQGRVPEARVNDAAGRILAMKARLGLFDDPYRQVTEEREKATLLKPEFLEASRKLARSTFVLLKNERQALPLQGTPHIALIGALAKSQRDLLGSWAGQGEAKHASSIYDELIKKYSKSNVTYAKGCDPRNDETSGFAEARAAADKADVVIAVLGETQDMSGEGNSRTQLELPGKQQELLEELAKSGKPIVLVLTCGRPLVLEKVLPKIDSLLLVWQPGTMGAAAIVDTLSGAYNPAGKLPVTFPRSVGQIPIFYNTKPTGRPQPAGAREQYKSNYLDAPNSPQFPFGYGLSYTRFAYDAFQLSGDTLSPAGGSLTATVTVQNAGEYDGDEVVQLYVRDLVGSATRPLRELKALRKVYLAKGEKQQVTFKLTPEDLAFWRGDMTYGPEAGDFEVYVGGDSSTTLRAKFKLTAN
jgi:beta-glucosidase